jgi:hypothetical protein
MHKNSIPPDLLQVSRLESVVSRLQQREQVGRVYCEMLTTARVVVGVLGEELVDMRPVVVEAPETQTHPQSSTSYEAAFRRTCAIPTASISETQQQTRSAQEYRPLTAELGTSTQFSPL